MPEAHNRQRDLATLALSDEARSNIAELVALREAIAHADGEVKKLRERMRAIWRRRMKKGDLWPTELARLSGVTQAYVTREIAKKKAVCPQKNGGTRD